MLKEMESGTGLPAPFLQPLPLGLSQSHSMNSAM